MGISSWVKPFLKAFTLQSCPATVKISTQNVPDLVRFFDSLFACVFQEDRHGRCRNPSSDMHSWHHHVISWRLSGLYPQWQEKMVLCCCSAKEKAEDRWVRCAAHSSEIVSQFGHISTHSWTVHYYFPVWLPCKCLSPLQGQTWNQPFLKSIN